MLLLLPSGMSRGACALFNLRFSVVRGKNAHHKVIFSSEKGSVSVLKTCDICKNETIFHNHIDLGELFSRNPEVYIKGQVITFYKDF